MTKLRQSRGSFIFLSGESPSVHFNPVFLWHSYPAALAAETRGFKKLCPSLPLCVGTFNRTTAATSSAIY